MSLLITTDISTTAWVLAFTAVFVMGVSKSGLKGISIIVVTLMP